MYTYYISYNIKIYRYSHAIEERFFDGRERILLLLKWTTKQKKNNNNNDGIVLYLGKKRNVTGASIYFLYYLYYTSIMCVRRTTTCHKPARTHPHMHAGRLTHTRNQLRYCRVIHVCVCVCVCVRTLYCVSLRGFRAIIYLHKLTIITVIIEGSGGGGTWRPLTPPGGDGK